MLVEEDLYVHNNVALFGKCYEWILNVAFDSLYRKCYYAGKAKNQAIPRGSIFSVLR